MAKSYDNLYPALTDFANLYLAYRKASRGKRGQAAVAEFTVSDPSRRSPAVPDV